MEVMPPDVVLKKTPLSKARGEEKIASNPPPVDYQPTLVTLDEATPINVEAKEPTANTTDDAHLA